MNKKTIVLIICTLLIATTIPVVVTGTNQNDNNSSSPIIDGEEWPMVFHDPQRTSFSTSEGPETNNIMSELNAGSTQIPVVISNDILYTGSSGISAYDANNGLLIDDYFMASNGPITIGSEKLIFTSGIFGLVCLDADPENWDGYLWITDITQNMFASPIIIDDSVYVSHMVSSISHISCFDIESGDELWDTALSGMSMTDIAYDDGKIFTFDTQNIICINGTDGLILWQTPIADVSDMFVGISPAIEDGILYTISSNGIIYALDLADEGSIEMEYDTGEQCNFKDSPALAYGYLYVGTQETMYCFDISDPTSPEWTYSYNDQPAITPIVADDKIYVRLDGLKCFDAMDGSLIWESDIISNVCPAISNGILYYSSGSTIYFFNENTAPESPSFNGPSEAIKNVEISFYANTVDPDDDDIYYLIDWIGNGDNYVEFGPFPSGVEQEITHIFTSPHYEGNRTFHIYCIAKDESVYGSISNPVGPHDVFVENHAPDIPIVSGPDQAYAGYSFTVQFTVSDPDNDINLALGRFAPTQEDPYYWDWTGNYESGETFENTYTVENVGIKTFKFKTGERGSHNGGIRAESEAFIYEVEIIEKPGIELEIGNLTATLG
ncbi:MAG: hypothetical protein DRN27_09065, partial [Thermoplasmata archaeon]